MHKTLAVRALVQRVSSAAVAIHDQEMARIGRGLVVFVAVALGDTSEDTRYIVDKVVGLRIFPDDQGRFDTSALNTKAELLLVSQFTLYADTRRGRRPSFIQAAPPEVAQSQFQEVEERFRATGLRVVTGQFQKMMDVSLVNDGPVTIWIDSTDRHKPRG